MRVGVLRCTSPQGLISALERFVCVRVRSIDTKGHGLSVRVLSATPPLRVPAERVPLFAVRAVFVHTNEKNATTAGLYSTKLSGTILSVLSIAATTFLSV